MLSHFEVLELYCKVWTTYSTVTTTNLFKLLQDQCTNAKTDAQLELQLESIQFLEEQRERFSEDAFAVSEIDLQLRMAEARHIELSSMVDSKTAALDPKAALTEAQQQLQYLMDNKSLIVKDATVMQMFTLTLEVERVWLQNVECRLMSSSSLEFAVPAPTPEETTTTTTTTVLSGGKRGIDDDVTPPSKGQTVLRHPKAGDVFVYKRAGGVLNGIISARRHVVKRGCKYEYHEIMDAVFESGSVVRVQPTLETISGYLMQKASSVSVIGNAVFVKDVAESGLQEWKFTAV